jgi:acetyl esterase/lipase
MRRIFLAAILLPVFTFAADKTPAHYNIPLWEPGQVPLAKGDGPLDAPFLTVFMPPSGKANGSSVIIAPGGSNIMLMYSMEGMEIAERCNDWGAVAFVLTYRLSPRYGHDARTLDGRRAVELVRSRAAEFKIDPKRIGLIGFSAGSELVRSTTASAGEDPNLRPDYIALVYSAGRPTPGEQLKTFPPTFFCVAQFDRGPALASAQLFTELTRAGAVSELHIYQKGRHGFGTGYGDPEASTWMEALHNFLVQGGFMLGGKR